MVQVDQTVVLVLTHRNNYPLYTVTSSSTELKFTLAYFLHFHKDD